MWQYKKYAVPVLQLTRWLSAAQTESLLQSQGSSLGSVPDPCPSHKGVFSSVQRKKLREAGGLTILK